MRWTRQTQALPAWFRKGPWPVVGRKGGADGEVVWSWRRDPGVKLSGKAWMATVAKEAAHQGEYEISRNTIARGGKPG
jgi:hypothetical protein